MLIMIKKKGRILSELIMSQEAFQAGSVLWRPSASPCSCSVTMFAMSVSHSRGGKSQPFLFSGSYSLFSLNVPEPRKREANALFRLGPEAPPLLGTRVSQECASTAAHCKKKSLCLAPRRASVSGYNHEYLKDNVVPCQFS